MGEFTILLATFASVLIVSALALNYLGARREMQARLVQAENSDAPITVPADFGGLPVDQAELLRNYYAVVRSDKDANSIQNRLIRAGYFSPGAPQIFQIVRVAVAFFVFALIAVSITYFLPGLSRSIVLVLALFAAALTFFLCSIYLERVGDKREIIYRRLFPDFMDSLIVCLDAGMSIEAAVDRVAKEFLRSTNRDFGLHLAIMMLEVRGGRRLRDALSLFAKRLRIEEAQSLATLFRQSEELGSSVTKTLRVFSQEMRDRRMIRAEEKANALPFKMLLPLAGFLFPISVVIVVIPLILRIGLLFQNMTPPS